MFGKCPGEKMLLPIVKACTYVWWLFTPEGRFFSNKIPGFVFQAQQGAGAKQVEEDPDEIYEPLDELE